MPRIVHGTLTANQVATVTLDEPYELVEVLSRNGAAEIYFRLDGQSPTVGGNDCQVVPAAVGSVVVGGITTAPTVVTLISVGSPTYTVSGS